MAINIKQVNDLKTLLTYFGNNLNWIIDVDSFESIEDITYGFEAGDIGLKAEEFSKIASLRQLRPMIYNQSWGIFAVEFDSKRFEITALRKVLSGLVPKRRNSEHAMWDKKHLLFLCFWGEYANRTVGVAYFEDKEAGLPQIKIIYCNPRVEDFVQLNHFESQLAKLSWPQDVRNNDVWQSRWAGAFTTVYHEVIRDSASLTMALAEVAKSIKRRILDILNVETTNGYVHLLYEKFRVTLIHDMTEEQFADMYAQTMVYGLFSARCMDTNNDFDPEEAIEDIPSTNPFLKKLLKECFARSNSKLSFDELQLNDIVEILQKTDIVSILKDFNRQTGDGREDPVIYFYEGFLNAYESAQKKRRGVYYTPQPVVKFMVTAVDDILKTEFGIVDGLASTETKLINVKRDSKRKIDGFVKHVDDKIKVPAIQILDPATGTGTFLRQTIIQIWETFKEKHVGKPQTEVCKLWNEYVPKHLLPRLNGFEIMMAPYAVAHMKLAMVLKETGYDFTGDERVNVFLTNSLEESGTSDKQVKLWDDPLAVEAIEANYTKKNNGINIVIGNPPYSGISANNGTWINKLIEDYKYINGIHFGERKHWLHDDYVKFIRYAQSVIENTGSGIVAYINPHGFIDNPTFRGMRWNLLQFFDKILIIDLHGNSKKKEKALDGTKDENVFDIQQGVAICVFIRYEKNHQKQATVFHADHLGLRVDKYNALSTNTIQAVNWNQSQTAEPFFMFSPQNMDNQSKYNQGFPINELMPINVTGVQTSRDSLVIDDDQDTLINRIRLFADKNISTEEIRKLFFPSKRVANYLSGDSRGWNLDKARMLVRNNNHAEFIKSISYRPFDIKKIYYSKDMIDWGREQIMTHMISCQNTGLIVGRQGLAVGTMPWNLVFITNHITDLNLFYRGGAVVYPLYKKADSLGKSQIIPNLNMRIVQKICSSLSLDYITAVKKLKEKEEVNPQDILDYIYAVLHSPNYRKSYQEFLKTDFPRITYPANKEIFWKLIEYGSALRKLHLMESHAFNSIFADPIRNCLFPIEQISFHDGKVHINKTEWIDNVPELAWDFYIGGYQPAQKWLKDRKGRVLSANDMKHYRKMICALVETDSIMKQIDEVFEF